MSWAAIDWDQVKAGYSPGTHVDSADPLTGDEKDELKAATANLYEDVLGEHQNRIEAMGLQGTISSAASMDISAELEDILLVTGTTGIGGFVAPAAARGDGVVRRLIFTDVLTITDSAALKCYPSGRRDIITAAGDVATMMHRTGSNWEMLAYQRADGAPLMGTIQEQVTDERTWSTIALPFPTWPEHLSLPQLSKTALLMGGVTITPKYTDSKIIVEGQAIGAFSGTNRTLALAIFKDAETSAREFSTPELATTAGYIQQTWIKYIMAPSGATSAMTFYMRGMSTITATTNWERNGSSGQARWGGAMCCRISAREVRT